MPWNSGNSVQFSTPPKMPRNPAKHATDKNRTRWLNRNHRLNPIKTNRFHTMQSKMTDMNKIDVVKPTPRKVCKHYSLCCSYCKQDAPHPSPIKPDWPSKDWDGNKAKAKEKNKSLIDFEAPNQKTDTEKIRHIDEVPFSKLQIGQDGCKDELLEVTELLVLSPSTSATLEDTT